jgi:hypothetical protein
MTSGSTGSSSTWSSLKASNWLAVMTMASATSRLTLSMREGRMPTSTAIALAVSGWSPVSMCTEMPASWHFPTACADSGPGGSYSPIRPRKVRSFSTLARFVSPSLTSMSTLREARASTRSPRPAKTSMFRRICARNSSVSGTAPASASASRARYLVQTGMMRSTAPLVKANRSPVEDCLMTTVMRLTSLSNGNSATSVHSAPAPCVAASLLRPNRVAKTWMAISVGSPRACQLPSFSNTVARFASDATDRKSCRPDLLSSSSCAGVTTEPAELPCSLAALKLISVGTRESYRTSPAVGLNASFEFSTVYVPRLGIQTPLATILPWVKVPVLSLQMSVTAPRASSDLRFRTMTFRCTILLVPAAMVMVKTTTKLAGIIDRPVATA